jgi:hypothetical protein
MQETAPQKSGAAMKEQSSTVTPKVVSLPSKGVKALKHASHKDEYRKDHAKSGAEMKSLPSSARK